MSGCRVPCWFRFHPWFAGSCGAMNRVLGSVRSRDRGMKPIILATLFVVENERPQKHPALRFRRF